MRGATPRIVLKAPRHFLLTIVVTLLLHWSPALAKDQKINFDDLDKSFPLLETGASPPGGWVDELIDGRVHSRVWKGQSSSWRTNHGPSTVYWRTGAPSHVRAARIADGTLVDIGYVLDLGYRRASTGVRRWIYGDLEIAHNEVQFRDHATQPDFVPSPKPDTPDLEADIAHDQAFAESLRDDRFAEAIIVVFKNNVFVRLADGASWSSGWRTAPIFVAKFRNLGESYLDFLYAGENFAGVYPDDRTERESFLIKSISENSIPLRFPDAAEFARKARSAFEAGERSGNLPPGSTRESLQSILDEYSAEIANAMQDQDNPFRRMEAARLQVLLSQQQELEQIRSGANSDVFEALRAHLTRLGWRTQNSADREQILAKLNNLRVEVLREIKKFEELPLIERPHWAESIAKQRHGPYLSIRKMIDLEKLSPAIRETYGPRDAEYRLDDLALTGRISEIDYKRLRSLLSDR